MTGRLNSTTQSGTRRRALFFGAGFGILLAGTVLVAAGIVAPLRQAAGAIGIPALAATKFAFAMAACLFVIVPAIVGVTLEPRVGRWPRRIGGALVVFALFSGWTTVSAEPVLAELPTSILVAYTLGVLLVFTGGLASGLAPHLKTTPQDSSTASISYQRHDSQPRMSHTDGGEEDDELTSPLDEDE